ncbi:MAG: acyltransferase [Myxococcota bacterium]|nr:acyltransferase [Myxococcota bacterium]
MRQLIKETVKKSLIKVGTQFTKTFPDSDFSKKYSRQLYMAQLYRDNRAEWNVEHARDRGVTVGENCRFFSCNFFSEPYLIEIGNHVLISGNVTFFTHDGSVLIFHEDKKNVFGHYGKIKINDNCFIGFGSTIMPNVEIGKNCVIAPKSLVAKSFPDNCYIMGSPAEKVSSIDDYKETKLKSPLTLIHEKYPYPNDYDISKDEKKSFIIEKVGQVPITPPISRK